MSDPIEEVTEDATGSSSPIEEPIEEEPVPVEQAPKQKRVMSDKQKECLKLAREKAYSYRKQLKEEKEKLGDDKPTKTKKLNKSQIKILELQKRNEEKEEVKEEIKEVKEVIKEIKEDAIGSSSIKEEIKEIKPIEEVKEVIEEVKPIKEVKPIEEVKQYKYVKDENGNLYLR